MALGIVSAFLSLFGCSKKNDTDCIDGGVVKNYIDPDAKKVIESSDIVSFECKYSYLGLEAVKYGGRVYTVTAEANDGEVKACISWYNNSGEGQKLEFKADGDFMKSLYEITSKYNFASHNGYYHSVSGLPSMYGASIDIKFASEEKIHAYDNQDCFLSTEALDELTQLFASGTDGEFEYNKNDEE